MSMRMAFGTASGALLLTLVILASVLIGARACGAGGEVVYVLPDGTQTAPSPEQGRQTEAPQSSAAQSQPQPAVAPAAPQTDVAQSQPQPAAAQVAPAAPSAPAAPQPPAADTETQPQPEQPQPTVAPTSPVVTSSPSTPPPVVNPRWQNKRNDLCSTLGLDAAVCGNIALNQSAPEGEAQDIELPDEPDATPVPVDDVEEATSELEEAVEAQGEVSIQALTYVESLISQAAEAVVQAEQALANQQATFAYLEEKRRELQRLRRAYAELLRKIGVELDKALQLAEQIETEHLAFSKERADGEALIRYKEARLAHTAALAAAEKNATSQIDAVASVNKAASNHAVERIDLAPLYKARDDAQAKYDAAVERFLEKVHEYEKNWLAVYEVYTTDPAVRDADGNPPWGSYVANGRSDMGIVRAYHRPHTSDSYKVLGADKLLTGTTSGVAENKGDFKIEPVNLTLLQKAVSDADQSIVRAAAANEKAQSVAGTHADAAASMGAAISDARLAVVEAYRKHGISEGGGGQIFRFTDSGEDAVTYNISLTALNADAEANLVAFKTALNEIIDDMHAAIRAAEDARDKALSAAEDARFTSADTVDAEERARQKWQDVENLRRRILLTDTLMMSAGYGKVSHSGRGYIVGYRCTSNADARNYWTAMGIGRDSYIRKYWHKEQPIDRTYTAQRLTAVESVVDKLEKYLQGRIDYWWEDEHKNESYYKECEQALSWFSGAKAEIVGDNPLSTD